GYLDAGESRAAARCAFWIGMPLFMRGEAGRGGGWLARAERLVGADDCVERGYLLMPAVYRKQAAGEGEEAAAIAAAAAEIGNRYGDSDLFALALHTQGEVLIHLGRPAEGLRLLDEAMLAVTGGDVSPIASGIIYCSAIVGCRQAFDPRRAQEWTAALHAWCERQPDMLAFTGACLVHRAEIMEL